MIKKEKKVLFVVGGDAPNPFHGDLGHHIKAKFFISNYMDAHSSFLKSLYFTIKSAFSLPRNYDIYLTETAFVIPVIARILGLLPRSAKIINLSADPVLYNLVHNEPLGLPHFLYLSLIRKVDGFVLIGNWSKYLDRLKIKAPRIEISAGINDTIYNNIIKIHKIKFNHNLIFVGNLTEARLKYKGIDILLGAYEIVKKKYPDSKLYITGQSNVEWIKEKYPDIIFTGYSPHLENILKHATICINMGRGDTFPIGTVEAMLIGLPAIVSNYTGTKAVVEKADKTFIIELDAQKVAEKIIWYFGLSQTKKKQISDRFRNAASKYKTSMVLKKFDGKWLRLLKELKYNEL